MALHPFTYKRSTVFVLKMFKPAAWAVTWCGILYPWILPALAEVDFAVAGSHSISAFIETPSATAAMVCF